MASNFAFRSGRKLRGTWSSAGKKLPPPLLSELFRIDGEETSDRTIESICNSADPGGTKVHPALGGNGHKVGHQSNRGPGPCAALSFAKTYTSGRDCRDAGRSAFERQHQPAGTAGLGHCACSPCSWRSPRSFRNV